RASPASKPPCSFWIHRAMPWNSSHSKTLAPCSQNKAIMTGRGNTDRSEWVMVPQGDRTLLLIFGDQIDVATGRRCATAAAALRAADLPGVTDVVPSFNQVALHYRPGLPGTHHDSGLLA